MTNVTIDYEGQIIEDHVSPSATHVVVSRRADGQMRVRGTRNPMEAIFAAKDAGEDEVRMAAIEDGQASFAPGDAHAGSGSPLVAMLRRSLVVLTIALVIVVLGVLYL